MYLNNLDYNRITLFNEKINRMDGRGFTRWALEYKSRRSQLQYTDEESGLLKLRYPDQDALESFVLTLRFFITKKDKCNIDSIEEVYNKLPSDQIERNSFSVIKSDFDNFLNSKSCFSKDGINLTTLELIEYIVYGNLAHANSDKKAVVDIWLRDDIIAKIYWHQFAIDLAHFYDFLLFFRELNRNLLDNHSLWLEGVPKGL